MSNVLKVYLKHAAIELLLFAVGFYVILCGDELGLEETRILFGFSLFGLAILVGLAAFNIGPYAKAFKIAVEKDKESMNKELEPKQPWN